MLKNKAMALTETVSMETIENNTTARLATTVACIVLGVLLPQGALYGGIAPLGVSLVAAVSGPGSVLVYIATLLGYLLPGGAILPLRYMAAVAVSGAVRWTFAVLPYLTARRSFAPGLAFAATLVSGLLMNDTSTLLAVLITIAESLAAGAFAYFFSRAIGFFSRVQERSAMSLPEQIGVALLGAGVLIAAAPLEFYYISPARVVAGVTVMLFARGGREQSGTVSGTVLGVALALAFPDRLYVALGLVFGGLVAGMLARYGRFAVAGGYVIANMLLSLTTAAELAAAAALYEAAAAALIFTILPRSVDKLLRRYLVYGQHIPAVEGLRHSMTMRLDVAARAMDEVAQTVENVSARLSRYGAPDLGSMYRCVGDTVCKHCNLNLYCWENNFSEIMDSFNALTPVLRERAAVDKNDLVGFLARSCRKQREVAQAVTHDYQLFLTRESAWQRLSEIRAVITDQFSGMGALLNELGERFAEEKRVDMETAGRVVALCEDFGMPVEEAICLLDKQDRLTVEILTADVGVRLDGGKWAREMALCCGREFDRPTVTEMQDMLKITLTERPLFRAEIGVAQRTCDGERLSGDVVEQYTDGGIATCIISDGMGSGGRAAVDGTLTAELTGKLLQAGLQPDTVLRLVNTALLAKSGDESLTTLDILQLDLFNGKIRIYKAGATTSLLRSGGRVSRMEAPSLPIGILRDTGFAVTGDTLTDGDIVLMMSDGMLAEGCAWIEEYLRDAPAQSPEALAEELLRQAVTRNEKNGYADDMTVIVVQLARVGVSTTAAKK